LQRQPHRIERGEHAPDAVVPHRDLRRHIDHRPWIGERLEVGTHRLADGPRPALRADEIYSPAGPEIGEVFIAFRDVEAATVVHDHLVHEAVGVPAAERRPETEPQLRRLVGAQVVLAELLDGRVVRHGELLGQPVVHTGA
jgi:hypothetical protein